MSSVILGATATLEVASTKISGLATGTDGMSMSASPDTSEIPGGGASFTRVGQFVTYDFSFTCDKNNATDDLFRAGHGTRKAFKFFDGVNTFTGSGIFAVTEGIDRSTNRISYSVSVQVDGKPTIS